jgi:hypothetical protein
MLQRTSWASARMLAAHADWNRRVFWEAHRGSEGLAQAGPLARKVAPPRQRARAQRGCEVQVGLNHSRTCAPACVNTPCIFVSAVVAMLIPEAASEHVRRES